jgi:hypothetical protein
LHEPGLADLGEMSLPHYDPRAKQYRIARAELGRVKVTVDPNAPAQASKTAAEETALKLSSRLAPRDQLGTPAKAAWGLTDRRWYWGSLGLAPLSVLVASGSLRIARRLAGSWASRRAAPGTLATRALAEARRALADNDATRAAVATERALFSAVEAATGVKARGVLRDALGPRLVEAGLDESTAAKVTELLGGCEAARFTGADSTDFGDRQVDEASAIVKSLARLGKSRSKSQHGGSA